MRKKPIDRLREICLALPEAHEVEAWGEPTFRVRKKIFAMHASPSNHHGAGRPAVWIKSEPSTQEFLTGRDPARFFVPPYVGVNGWVGVWLDGRPDWKHVAELVREGYCAVAPKKLAKLVEDQ